MLKKNYSCHVKCIFFVVVFIWVLWYVVTTFFLINYVDAIRPLQLTLFGLPEKHFDFLIFQIGFNKCGTTSLFRFMEANNIPSAHNVVCNFEINSDLLRLDNVYLNKFMITNYRNNQSVLPPMCTHFYRYYSDFGNEVSGLFYTLKRAVLDSKHDETPSLRSHVYSNSIHKWYTILFEQFAAGKFILNIRNINTWLKSEYLHRAPLHKQRRFNGYKQKINAFIEEYNLAHSDQLQIAHLSDIDILRIVRSSWYLYICNAMRFFEQNNASENLLIFHIEIDAIEKLIDFFAEFGITLDATYWRQKNQSNGLEWTSQQDQKQREQWDEIERDYSEFGTDYSNVSETEYDRINTFCSNLVF